MLISRIFQRKMSQNVVLKLINNAEIAEKKIVELRTKVCQNLLEQYFNKFAVCMQSH